MVIDEGDNRLYITLGFFDRITHFLSLQETGFCPHLGHWMGFLGFDPNLVVQEAARPLPLHLEEVPCLPGDTCVGQRGGGLQGALEDTHCLLEL